MKSWACLIATVVLGLTAPALALAQGQHDWRGGEAHHEGEGRGRGDYAPAQHGPAYGPAYTYGRPNYAAPPAPSYAPRRPAYPAYPTYPAYPGARAPAYGAPRYGSAPTYGRWRRGQVLPPAYRGDVIEDYGRYHLRRPPRGYYWIRQGDDFVLVAITTGLIFDVISGGY